MNMNAQPAITFGYWLDPSALFVAYIHCRWGEKPSCSLKFQPSQRSTDEQQKEVSDITLFLNKKPNQRVKSFSNYFGLLKYSRRESSSAEREMTQINFSGFIKIENIFDFLAVLLLVISPFSKVRNRKAESRACSQYSANTVSS